MEGLAPFQQYVIGNIDNVIDGASFLPPAGAVAAIEETAELKYSPAPYRYK